MSNPIRHFFIPDCQVKDGVPLDHLTWAGKYIAEKQPDVVVCGGDFADMPSLSSYDKGKKSYEGRRYRKDIDAVRRGMEQLLQPVHKSRKYKPRLVLTLGNHEDRINRAVEDDAKLDGHMQLSDLGYADAGWEVIPYLKPIKINGVTYSHYFTYGKRQYTCASAKKILSTQHTSCIAGHQQGFDIAVDFRGDGTRIMAIIAGSFYLHHEEYLGNQGNHYWRGCLMLHEVKGGEFDPMFVSINYLRRKFGK